MIFVGLGSNLGNRELNLRKAIDLITRGSDTPMLRHFRISAIYKSEAMLPENSQPGWNTPYFNVVISGETDLSPEIFFRRAKEIEEKLGRKERERWAPREIDIDILAWDSLVKNDWDLKIPHPGLLERPFALLPLAELDGDWIYPVEGPHYGKRAYDLSAPWKFQPLEKIPFETHSLGNRFLSPRIVGIVNVTPDSFSDGGENYCAKNALVTARRHFQSGAEILDIGAESTRPGATPISSDEEWVRLAPFFKLLADGLSQFAQGPVVSLDTHHHENAKRALALGVHWINDVTGFEDPQMCKVVADSNAKLVMMHNLGVPPSKELTIPLDKDPIKEIITWAEVRLERLKNYGIDRQRVVFDPGIGFGKTPEQSFYILKNVRKLHDLGLEILIGHSRKSFLTSLTSRAAPERDIETLSVSLYLAQQGVQYLRVHNVDWHARALRALDGIGLVH